MIGPANAASRRFRKIAAPREDGRLLAPISATDAGLSRYSRLRPVMSTLALFEVDAIDFGRRTPGPS